MNRVTLIGNLGRDPELRHTASGQPVATVSLATTERWRDKNGERQERTEWHRVVMWGHQATLASQYLVKGKQICVEGAIRTRSWDDKQTGEKRYSTEIISNQFHMLGPAPQQQNRDDAPPIEDSYEAGNAP